MEQDTMTVETFDDPFEALGVAKAEAANMTFRADVLLAIREQVRSWGLSQEKAAARLGVTRPRLSDLLRGQVDKFSLDALVNIATAAGLRLTIEVGGDRAA
ncbi:putative XRE-type DNA-binding protein [Rhizobium sp. SG_E_25_P2]|uniref:helix-turn-helix domain-containing protein n=1 Tax=Rhizobium sp. SG_E_25_P2 TaxID=2879942 RepID=UPI0024740945|nr:helix-turn-helix transcriptional regulator [Rhizobium sp. SG_E_25_P2]MDH6267065.1 putative XRE-type DNA-binding protein [Rhizobium sp. SG_E_25_P2]